MKICEIAKVVNTSMRVCINNFDFDTYHITFSILLKELIKIWPA